MVITGVNLKQNVLLATSLFSFIIEVDGVVLILTRKKKDNIFLGLKNDRLFFACVLQSRKKA